MVSRNDCKYYNVIESWKTVFLMVSRLSSVLSKACFLYYFRAVFKGLALLRILNFKSIPPYSWTGWTHGEVTPLLIKLMTSQAYSDNKVLLFLLYIWKQALQINYSDQLINEIMTVWASAREKYKTLGQFKCLACLNFLIDLRFSMVFTEGRGGEEWRNSNRMERGCWCFCGSVFLPPPIPSPPKKTNLVETNFVKLRSSEAAIQGWYEKYHTLIIIL